MKANFFFCAARPVPALKVHKGKQGNKIFRATRAFFFSLLGPVPTPEVHKESKEKFSCWYALENRKLCVSLCVNKVNNVPSLCATNVHMVVCFFCWPLHTAGPRTQHYFFALRARQYKIL